MSLPASKLRRLERVRERAFDRARADAAVARVAAERARLDADGANDALVHGLAAGFEPAPLECDLANLDALHVRAAARDEQLERAQLVTAERGRAWQRAQKALERALEQRATLRRRIEQREHDELAARRKP